jgi:hypothetical protein
MSVKGFLVSFFISLAVVTSGSASAQDAAAQLKSVEQMRLRALVEANMEVAYRLHSSDFQLITPLGGTVSKDQYLGMIGNGDIDYIEWEPEDIEVKMYSHAAVLRYQATIKILVKGNPDAPSGRFWHTDLYEKRDGQWQVVWSQATEIRGG